MTRAYHEKERRWQRELGQVLERVRQSENNEARTISEMQRVREDLQRLQLHVNQLESEKYGLQKTVIYPDFYRLKKYFSAKPSKINCSKNGRCASVNAVVNR
jgi:hypothetical protein